MLPRVYVCGRASEPPQIDGRVDKPFWQSASWTEPFVDILGDGGPVPRFQTRVKMLWDDEHLYIGAELEEPHVWGTLTDRDSVIFHDNDFEVFLDPEGDNHMYAEIELNALNTVWDLLLVRPYRDGGPAISGWNIHGLRTAVSVDGTLNDPSDEDRGWSLEMAIPWRGIKEICGTECPPRIGDQWRINFSRVEWEHEVVDGVYRKVDGKPEDNWVWSPHDAVDMHRPEQWGILQFAESATDALAAYRGAEERDALMALYYAQREHRLNHGVYATSLTALTGALAGIELKATELQWTASKGRWSIDHRSQLRKNA